MEVVVFIAGVLVGLLIMAPFRLRTNTIVKADYDPKEEIMTVVYGNGKVLKYHGSSTVWRSYPMMKRMGTFKEGELCDIWKYIKTHGNSYPTAHE